MDLDTKIGSYLSEFGDDLWIKRRLELNEILSTIESYVRNDNESSSSSSISWLRFVQFLAAECSGQYFSCDKQWSELINLMQISKKLNHRSVKFKDIIKNKQVIEANEKSIRELNGKAKLLLTIESSLNQLESLLNDGCILVLRNQQNPRQQLDEILVAKKYLDDRCHSILSTLQMELNSDLLAANQSKNQLIQANCQRVQKFQLIIESLSNFLDDLRLLHYNLLQLSPLINADREVSSVENSSKSNQLENSIDSCKHSFAKVQEFRGKIMNYLSSVSASGSGSANQRKSKLFLIKLINSSDGQMNKQDMLVLAMKNALIELDKCKSTLDSIMHNLRLEFGRFYFVSDLELLTIIALDAQLVTQSDKPQTTRLLSKLFNNSIQGFMLDESKLHVIGVKSPLNEEVVLFDKEQFVPIRKSVNLYSLEIVRILNETLRKLRKTLQIKLITSLQKQQDQIDWSLPVQLMNLAEQIKFCQKVEFGLREENNIEKVLNFYEDRFNKLSSKPEPEVEAKIDEFKLSAAISMTVQFISTLGNLREIKKVEDWRWLKLIRYYRTPKDTIEVRIADTSFDYKFDYLPPQTNSNSATNKSGAGGFKRLINTQITERCLLAASQSIGNFRLGSSPFGPAGSGKTETIKALGVALGSQVIVHNCDESNDGQSLDQLIWGLAHTGLWGCFDEFNRLSSSALSSISSTLELVQASIRESKHMVELLDGRIMPVDESTCFFVTLNPADSSKGYLGRRRLPANLRQLFLPIAMTRVQIDTIVSESLLALNADCKGKYCFSLQEAQNMAEKLANFIDQLAEETQNQQNTCVWDLRLIMSILKRLKLLVLRFCHSDQHQKSLQHLLVQSIEYEIRPRLPERCTSLFEQVLDRNFSSSKYDISDKEDQEILQVRKLGEVSLEKGKISILEQHVIQLKRLLDTRSGVILLGPSGSGKSTSWRLLHSNRNESTIKWLPVNPRSCARDKLFGYVDQTTRKWNDGLITARVREAIELLMSQDSCLEQIWLVLDGPIDPDWIESFNSVLDDNQVLTLSSGERLSFQPTQNKSIKLIIESSSVEFASPATISRLGLVLYETVLNQTKPLCRLTTKDKWQKELEEAHFNEIINDESSLLVVIGGSVHTVRSELVGEILLNATELIFEFNCSPFSSCSELLDLIATNAEATWFVINNVHLIEEEDQWKVKSFMELLRFIITYGGFYDKQLVFRKFTGKFILTTNSDFQAIDQRALGKANFLINLHNFENESIDKIGEDISIVSFLEVKLHEKDLPIITLSTSNIGLSADIMANFSGKFKLFTFNTSKEAQRSVEYLKELLDKRKQLSKFTLFLLNDLECELMSQNLKSQLFYQLNRLKCISSQIRAKFIFLSHDLSTGNSNKTTFWRSLGPIFHFNISVINELELREDLQRLIENNLKNEEESKWLKDKISNLFVEAQLISKVDRPLERYVSIVINLIQNSQTQLESQKVTFGDGLRRLEEFEGEVENIKSICEKEKFELNKRKSEITNLMSSIDKTLIGSKQQQVELNELKQKQSVKQNEINSQSQRVNRELAEVSKLVDRSKAEVAQYLKPEALNEIKALRSPPTTIKDILDVLFVLLRIEDCSWLSMRSHLNKLKDELTNYDFSRENLNDQLLKKAEVLIATKKESFSDKQAARASKAIVPILGWIKATIEYGRVSMRLAPLSDQMQQLELEATSLRNQAEDLELKVTEVEGRIKLDSEHLVELKRNHEESMKNTLEISKQLEKAQLARNNLENQIGRWRHRLSQINSWLKGKELMGICCVVSAMILFNDDDELFENWIKLFELNKLKTREEFTSKVLDLLVSDSNCSVIIKPEEASKILQLVCLKLSLSLNHLLPPLFVDLGSNKAETVLSHEEIVQYLTFKSLFCHNLSCLSIIKCNQLNNENNNNNKNWRQSIELNLKLEKLVMIELEDDSLEDLDIMDYVFTKCLSSSSPFTTNNNTFTKLEGNTAGKGNICSSSSSSNNNKQQQQQQRLLLLGKLDKHANIRNLVLPVRLLIANSPATATNDKGGNVLLLRDIQSNVMDYLMAKGEFKLYNETKKLEFELSLRQQECRQRELKLLSRLANCRLLKSTSDSRNLTLDEDLLVILNELHQLSEEFQVASVNLDKKLEEFKVKQEVRGFKQLAFEAAQFYVDYLANLIQVNKFYGLSLETYLHLLLHEGSNKHQQLVGGSSSSNLNYQQVIKWVKQSMKPDEFKLEFELKLQDKLQKGDVFISSNKNKEQSTIHGSIMELLNNISSVAVAGEFDNNNNNNNSKLMVVLHEPTKSSPQLEIDELFRQLKQSATNHHSIVYLKIYATSDTFDKLENALNSLQVESNTSPKLDPFFKLQNKEEEKFEKQICCLCIANAHLAAKWLNSRLVQFLRGPLNRKVLIILIGEVASGTNSEAEEEFDRSLFELAQVKWWHDDSMLELTSRLNLFSKTLSNQSLYLTGDGNTRSVETNNKELVSELTEQLVLFHVICQEAIKPLSPPPVDRATNFWRQNYSFDYNQLCLAVKSLLKISKLKNNLRLREHFCHYLREFVYGARLEYLEDELTLNQMIEKFLKSKNSARLQVNRVKRLEATYRNAATSSGNVTDQYKQQLLDLLSVD